MTIDELRNWLRLWGRTYGERAADFADIDRDSPDVHPLAVARHFAPGSRTAVALAARRDGSSRRRHMARDLAACGIRVIPVTFVDPVVGTSNSRGSYAAPSLAPARVLEIQAQVMRMVEDFPRWGLSLQAQYCIRGARGDKADWVASMLKEKVTPRDYRTYLDGAHVFLLGRLTAAA